MCSMKGTSCPYQLKLLLTSVQFFAVLDAMKGYHQCPLDESTQTANNFYHRFKYLVSFIVYHPSQIMVTAWLKLLWTSLVFVV